MSDNGLLDIFGGLDPNPIIIKDDTCLKYIVRPDKECKEDFKILNCATLINTNASGNYDQCIQAHTQNTIMCDPKPDPEPEPEPEPVKALEPIKSPKKVIASEPVPKKVIASEPRIVRRVRITKKKLRR